MNTKKCALVVGHSAVEQGARNKVTGVTEFMFNSVLADAIEFDAKLYNFTRYTDRLASSITFGRPVDLTASTEPYPGYNQELSIIRVNRESYRYLPREINILNPDFIVSLHCNAYDRKTSGTEVLYWHASRKGKKIARLIQSNLVDWLKLKDRGIVPVYEDGRGAHLLKNTIAPCVIVEPFFIDNSDDLLAAAGVFIKGIARLSKIYFQSLLDIAQNKSLWEE